MSRFVARTLAPVLLRASREFPAVVLTGPRQSGKTTLLRRLFPRAGYVSLEPLDVRAAAQADPRGFLALHPPPVILDEVQHAPDLLPYLKELIDARRSARGRWLLTGSQNLALGAQVGETLAGRAAVLQLLPLSRRELDGAPDRPLPWERAAAKARGPGVAHGALWSSIVRGGYPELALARRRDATLWHRSYLQTYLERDVRGLRQVGSLTEFRAFLVMLAARSGQLLNMADLARDLGVALNTVKAWIGVLEATYQIVVLRPWFANIGKRLVKTPKVYFTDSGILCHLLGFESARAAATSPLAGAIFETAVIGELFRALVHRGAAPRLGFFRSATGLEVDVIVEHGGAVVPIEIKASATPRPAMAASIEALRGYLGERLGRGFVVHGGEERLPLGRAVEAVPLWAL